jgi:hypothetical protein
LQQLFGDTVVTRHHEKFFTKPSILLYNFSKAFSFINLALKDEIFLLTDEE